MREHHPLDPAERILIVNADDFGRSAGINHGVIRAHEAGIVTSTSLMVRWPAAAEAAEYAVAHPELSIGIHVDLAEWVYQDGEWAPIYIVADDSDPAAVGEELDRQLETFRRLTGHDPSHLDSHQHVHRHPEVQRVFGERAEQLAVPLREATPGIDYCGTFFGQSGKGDPYPAGITVEALVSLLESLPSGITELACHPGLEVDYDSPYQRERALEVEALCDDRVIDAIHRIPIRLQSFGELKLNRSNRAVP